LPFLPFFNLASAITLARRLNCSGFAGMGNVSFRVMGGKSGKKWQGDVATCGKGVGRDGKGGKDGTMMVASAGAGVRLFSCVDAFEGATGRACATHVSYQDGKPIIAGNLPRQQANALVALPAQPRRADWQANFAFQTTSLGGAWSGWADDAVNYTWNGYYVGMEGYAHIPIPGPDPHVFVDLSWRHVATWLGVGGFFGSCGQDHRTGARRGALAVLEPPERQPV
jgi:hypothetical protein